MRSSILASSAPMQRWMPCPNARWALFGTRNGSNSSGSCAGGRSVAVGAGQRREQHVAPPDPLAEQLHVLLREPRESHLHHREVAQQLIDGALDLLRGSVAHECRVLGIAQQHDRAERDHAGRRLEAAGEDAVGEAGEVDVTDRVALLTDDLTDQARARILALARDGIEQELPLRRDRTEGRRSTESRVEPGAAELRERVPVVVVEAEQRADRLERHRERQLLGEIYREPSTSISSSCPSTISSMIGISRASRRIVNSGVTILRSRVCVGGSVKPRPPMSSDVAGPSPSNR